MPRGKNYVNNNKGMALQASTKKSKSKSSPVQMLECQYGTGCTRPDCIYRHPYGKASSKGGSGSGGDKQQSAEPCMPYLAGLCTFTSSGCRKRHPPKAECERLIARYKETRCRFGDSCRTRGCLYVHPRDDDGAKEEGGQMEEPAYVMPPQSFPALHQSTAAAATPAAVSAAYGSASGSGGGDGGGGTMSAQAQSWTPGGHWKVAVPGVPSSGGGASSAGMAHGGMYATPSQQAQYRQAQYQQQPYYPPASASATTATPPSALGNPSFQTPPSSGGTGMWKPTSAGVGFGAGTPPTPASGSAAGVGVAGIGGGGRANNPWGK